MKANELRIENWVNHDGRLISIELKHFQDILLYPNEQRKYAPIPLTEDWLLKFGFEKNFESTGVNIKYVHQLQNIYHALTGEELTIKQNDEK